MRRARRDRWIGWAVAALLVAAAAADQLRRPAPERTWTGRLAGLVPYDLRRPTWHRIRGEFWAPDDPRLLTPHAVGVGWGLNLGRLARLVRLVP